jgi:hypothetical protein
MVGNLGEVELAAVGLSTQLFFVHYGVMFGFSSGAAAFMAQFWGKQDVQSIRKVAGFAILICFSISLLFFLPAFQFPDRVLRLFTDIPEVIVIGKDFVRIAAVSFLTLGITFPMSAALRTTQQTSLPMKISAAVFSVNTILGFTLIFGNFGAPALGVKGAAMATATARLLELTLYLYIIFIRKNLLAGSPGDFFGWRKPFAVRILVTATPVIINETMWSLGMATYNAAYGRMGVTEFAAIQASNTLNTLFILAIFSLGDALPHPCGSADRHGTDGLCLRLGQTASADRTDRRRHVRRASDPCLPVYYPAVQLYSRRPALCAADHLHLRHIHASQGLQRIEHRRNASLRRRYTVCHVSGGGGRVADRGAAGIFWSPLSNTSHLFCSPHGADEEVVKFLPVQEAFLVEKMVE